MFVFIEIIDERGQDFISLPKTIRVTDQVIRMLRMAPQPRRPTLTPPATKAARAAATCRTITSSLFSSCTVRHIFDHNQPSK